MANYRTNQYSIQELEQRKEISIAKYGDPFRNVRDEWKSLPNQQIKDNLRQQAPQAAILVSHIQGDFNFGNVIRSANNFGICDIFYYGKKHIDRRATVGTHHYLDISYFDDFQQVLALKNQYSFVGLENNVPDVVPLKDFQYPSSTLFCFGEEGTGIDPQLLEVLDHRVEIPSLGSVRSLNLASAAAIALYDYTVKVKR